MLKHDLPINLDLKIVKSCRIRSSAALVVSGSPRTPEAVICTVIEPDLNFHRATV